jgi:hypothetical protein
MNVDDTWNILSPIWKTRLAESSALSNISQHTMWDNLTAPIHSTTLTRNVYILRDRHISLQGVNEFIPVMLFSNCELRESQWSKSHTLLKGINQNQKYFLHFFVPFGLTSASHVYKNVLSNCEFRKNRSESRTSPRGVDEILTILTLTYDVGSTTYQHIMLVSISKHRENRQREGRTYL